MYELVLASKWYVSWADANEMHKRKLAKVIDCCFELKEEENEKKSHEFDWIIEQLMFEMKLSSQNTAIVMGFNLWIKGMNILIEQCVNRS